MSFEQALALAEVTLHRRPASFDRDDHWDDTLDRRAKAAPPRRSA